MKTYKRAIKMKSFGTAAKQSQMISLIRRYRKQVNLFIDYCYENTTAKLDKVTLASIPKIQDLSERYKSNALKQALSLCKNPMTKGKPKFNGFPILDAKFVNIQQTKTGKHFDLWVKISTLKSGSPIFIPTKKHKRLNYWLSRGQLINGCELRPDGFIFWVEVEMPKLKATGLNVGVDIGMNKLITTSYGELIGLNWNSLNSKILKKKKNSNAYKRVLKEKKNYINKCVNELPWTKMQSLSYENLKNLKHGSKKKNKSFRIKQQYWSYRQVIEAMKMKGQENRVLLVYVNPAFTSQSCSSCGNIAASSRSGENYCCISCDYKQDADLNASINIRNKGMAWITSLKSVNPKNDVI